MFDNTHGLPEPGVYKTIDFAADILGAPHFGFGSEVKLPRKKGRQPGPGSYELSSTIGSKSGVPVYSMRIKDKDHRPKVGVGVPGPDVYFPNDTLTSSTSLRYSLSKQPKDPNYTKLYPPTPGCTAYFPDSSLDLTKTHSA